MPTLTPNPTRPTNKTERSIGTNKAVSWLDQIMAATAGTASGTDALTVLNRKVDEANLIGHGTNNIPATETSPWIYVRTDDDNFFIKERTGSPGSYTYQYLGPFFEGTYEARIIYSAAATPATPVPTWNEQNATFNLSGGDWAVDTPNAVWWRLILLPKNSNAPIISPLVRIGNPTAADISVVATGFTGNLDTGDTDLQRVAQKVNDLNITPQTPEQDVLLQVIKYEAPTRNPPTFQAVGSNFEDNFTINSDLTDYQTTFGERLFIEAVVDINIQGTNDEGDMSVRLEILDSSGRSLRNVNAAGMILSDNIRGDLAFTVPGTQTETHQRIRASGLLPAGFTGGRWRISVLANDLVSAKLGWVNETRLEIRTEIKAEEVTIDPNDYGNNLRTAGNLDDVVSQVDELPIQYSDSEDTTWAGAPNYIQVSDNEIKSDEISVHQLIQDINDRANRQFTIRPSFDAQILGAGVTGGRFTYRLYSVDGNDAETLIRDMALQSDQTITDGVSGVVSYPIAGGNNLEASLRDDTVGIRESFQLTTGGSNARLAITNSQLEIIEGINSAGFDGNLDTDIRSVQSLAQAVDDLSLSGSTAATAITVNNTQFSSPIDFIGGLREPLPTTITQAGLVNNPTNVQEALVKTDFMLQGAYDAYQVTQKTENFTVVGTGDSISSNIDIPELLRDISEDLIVRVRVNAAIEPATFRGRIRIIASDTTTPITGTDPYSINGSLSSQEQGQDLVFQQRIAAADVPDTFRIRIEGTSTNTATATFNSGHVQVRVADGDAMAMAGGQASDWIETIIWTAGLTTTARLTNNSVQTLLAGHSFGQYDFLQFNFDNGNSDGQLFPMTVLSSQFRASANYGTFMFSDMYGYNVQPHGSGDNQFRFIWNGGGTKGLRRILGVSIA